MTPEHKEIVRQTWTLVVPIADMAADLFYDKLFELDPDLTAYFQNVDLSSQKKKLLQALAMTVASLDNLESLVPQLSDLGRRHAGYGVVDSHYETVGRALLWTLEQGLQDAWTPASQEAWTAAYEVVSDTMKLGAIELAQSDQIASRSAAQ
ncbi:MAG: globin family protein [Pseudomonadota bacterium]